MRKIENKRRVVRREKGEKRVTKKKRESDVGEEGA
jgi:hypothetical protein